jgi:hypothetical protein
MRRTEFGYRHLQRGSLGVLGWVGVVAGIVIVVGLVMVLAGRSKLQTDPLFVASAKSVAADCAGIPPLSTSVGWLPQTAAQLPAAVAKALERRSAYAAPPSGYLQWLATPNVDAHLCQFRYCYGGKTPAGGNETRCSEWYDVL